MSDDAYVYGIRTANADMTSYGGFRWPESGPVEAPDWRDDDTCGGGLHFLLPGQNSPGTWYDDEGAKWLVLRVKRGDYRTGDGELAGKAKCRRCKVVYCGDMPGAMRFLAERGVPGPWCRGTATAGDCGTATAGDRGTATAGDSGTATAGDRGTATAGDSGTIQIKYCDGNRYRFAVGYVGEDGIEPNVAYRVDGGQLVKATK